MECFPELIGFISSVADDYTEGVECDLDDLHEGLYKVNVELSQYQKKMLDIVVQANVEHFFMDVVEDLEALSEDDGLPVRAVRGALSRLSQNAWSILNGLTEESVLLPRSDSNERMWKVMGYQPFNKSKSVSRLVGMVKERILRLHPEEEKRARVWSEDAEGNQWSKLVKKAPVQWTQNSEFSLGIVGDLLAEIRAQLLGVPVPCLSGKNFFILSRKELMEFADEEKWGHGTPKKMLAFQKSMVGRKLTSKTLAEKLFGTNEIAKMMFVSKNPNLVWEFYEMGLGQIGRAHV